MDGPDDKTLPGVDGYLAGVYCGTRSLGLHFQLEKGWHIYWVNPGDSGEPPRVTWQLPTGLSAGVIEWPAPRRIGTSSVVDFGYQDAVTLIVPVHAETSLAAQPLARLGAEIKVLVCREMCIPGKTQLSLTLPIKSRPSAPDVRTRELFAAALKDLPRPAPQNWKFSADDAKDSFVLVANVAPQITQAIFFPLADAQIDNSAPQILQPQPQWISADASKIGSTSQADPALEGGAGGLRQSRLYD
jgi:DsbC/DsbD-like thiol-disulfide interchange protein